MIAQRIGSAVVVGVSVVAAIWLLPAKGSAVALSVLLFLAAVEWSGLLGATANLNWRIAFLVCLLLFCALLWRQTGTPQGMRQILLVALAFWVTALLWLVFLPQRADRLLAFVVGVLALGLGWIALTRMRTDWALGRQWVLYCLGVVWAADSAAFFAGRAWGKRKLAPKISPGKTWAGLIGGVMACAGLAAVAAPWLNANRTGLMLITIIVALFSVVGDLTESLFKRYAGVKDSGTLIPGHGGVLDRFDSLLAAAPVLMWGALSIGRLPP